MEFQKYQHVERFGTTETNGIELGDCIVFPKLDGANGSVWLGDDGQVKAGSRNRELSLDADNAGFLAYISEHNGIWSLLKERPNWRLFGEWLVPHTLKTYREDAWRKFYVFDILRLTPSGIVEWLPFYTYESTLQDFGIDYVPPICIIKNPSEENLYKLLENNTFLIQDGKGSGEGIVIKNYDFVNRYGRTTWAKIVCNEFKEKNKKAFGTPEHQTKEMVEQRIVDDYCTEAFIEKEYQKIVTANDGWSNKNIPELLGRVWHEFVREECWNFVKGLKNPTINFRTLNSLVVNKIKATKPELF